MEGRIVDVDAVETVESSSTKRNYEKRNILIKNADNDFVSICFSIFTGPLNGK